MTELAAASASKHARLDAAAAQFCRAWRECGYDALGWFPGAVDARVFPGTTAQASMARWVCFARIGDRTELLVFASPDSSPPADGDFGSPASPSGSSGVVGRDGALWSALELWRKRLVLDALVDWAKAAASVNDPWNGSSVRAAEEAVMYLGGTWT